ncbi:MAG: hypothetical protein ACJ8F3_11670 [Xanthobacteraceae bacterium]
MSVGALPILTRDQTSAWGRATELRDWVYEAVEGACRNLDIEALVQKSIDLRFPAWVSLEAWLPAGAPGATRRRFCVFYIDPKPHAQFEFELRIECSRDDKKELYGPYAPEAAKEVAQWVSYMLDKGPEPNKRRLRLRKLSWELWYPANRISRFRYDALTVAGYAGLAAGALLALFSPPFLLLGLLILGICFAIRASRTKIVVNAGRPTGEPRSLRLVDSWQTMLNELGPSWESVRTRLFRRLTEGRAFNIEPRLENISYVTLDGKQERQQLVLTQNRGQVFCHVYPYGNDVFVGWEAYLNTGCWVERTLATGFDTSLQSPVLLNTVEPGRARVTEYDLFDLNGLTEWTHTRVVQVIKQMLEEHKLDQEIDFKITQRGARGSLVSDTGQESRSLFSRGQPAEAPGAPRTFTGHS